MKNTTKFNGHMKMLLAPLLFCVIGLLCFHESQAQCNFPASFAHDTPVVYPWASPSQGYVGGNSTIVGPPTYLVDTFGERFSLGSGLPISGAYLYFGYLNINPADSNNSIAITLLDNTGTDAYGQPGPGAVKANGNVSFNQIAAAITATHHSGILTPVYVPLTPGYTTTGADFYIVINMAGNPGDTLALFTTTPADVAHAMGYIDAGQAGWAPYDSILGTSLGDYVQVSICPPSTNAPAAAFTDSIYAACRMSTVKFFDQSTNSPLNYNWTFPGGSPATSSLQNPVVTYPTPGTYIVTHAAANTAGYNIITDTIVIANPPGAPVIDSFINQNVVCGQHSGNINMYLAAYNFTDTVTWSHGISSTGIFSIQEIPAGIYTVTVSDTNGCQTTGVDTVLQVGSLVIDSAISSNYNCTGVGSGSACIYASGGTGNYSYAWTPTSATTQCVTNLSAGIYDVTVSDTAYCSVSTSFTITGTQPPTSDFTASSNVCAGQNAVITYTGSAVSGAVYTWNFGGGTIASGSGQGPYNVNWSNSDTVYVTLLVTENGCTSSPDSQMVVVSAPTANISGATTTCPGSPVILTANVIPAGGTYVWSPGAELTSGITVSPTVTTTYTITYTDFAGCAVTASATVIVSSSGGNITITASQNPVCAGDSAIISAPPGFATYAWNTGDTTSSIVTSFAGIYNVTATNGAGCSSFSNNLSLSIFSPVPVTIAVNGDTLAAANDPYTWLQWNLNGHAITGANDSLLIAPDTGYYSLTIRDIHGCSYTSSSTYIDSVANTCNQCVWPGDANEDGIVDNNDLLPIGLAYGATGPTRPDSSINWVGQPAPYWSDSLADSTNYKFIDCNGDGTIDYNDTTAISVNYSLIHPRNSGHAYRSSDPALNITLSGDTLVDGEVVTATLSLGDSTHIVSNAYGLAYTYNYDHIAVDSNSVSMDFGNSWLCSAGDHMNFAKTITTTGMVEAAITRIDHQTRTGYGPIAHVSMKITTGNINGKTYAYYDFLCYISGLTVIDNAGHVIPVNLGSTSAQIAYLPTGIITPGEENTHVHIFPNPASDQLHIESAQSNISQWQILDMMGNIVVQQQSLNSKNETIDISELAAGNYLINVLAGDNLLHSRFVKLSK